MGILFGSFWNHIKRNAWFYALVGVGGLAIGFIVPRNLQGIILLPTSLLILIAGNVIRRREERI